MKKIKKLCFLFLILILPFTFTYKVKAEGILNVEKITQIKNSYNVRFNVISNYEVSAIYEDLGDTLEFEVLVKNKSTDQNAIIKNLTILTDSEGVDYTATLDKDDLEIKPGESRTIRVKGILNDKAFDSEKIIKIQLKYTVTAKPCPDCNKPLPVVVNPTTGDNISKTFIILGISIAIVILVLILIFVFRKKNKTLNMLLFILSLGIVLSPIYEAKADTEYVLEIIIHQTIRINKLDDTITATEIVRPYTGDPVDGEFDDESKTPITPIYFDDDECQNPINGKPVNAGVYYATATSEGNNWYNPGELECTKVITINKIPSSCPVIEDVTATFDGNPHSLTITGEAVGGILKFSLDNVTWTTDEIAISSAGTHNVYSKVVGDPNHTDLSCGMNTITISKKNLTVKASDQTKEYDGTPLLADNTCEAVGESYGLTITCANNTGSISTVGQADKTIGTVTVKDGNVDVTNNYNIIPEKGTLTITANNSARVGSCINPTYSGVEQNLVSGGNLVDYSNNTGINADEYVVTVTALNNYAFEDGTTTKTITCSIEKRNITIKAKDQEIEYGNEISKTLNDVTVSNLVEGEVLNSITLTPDGTEVTDSGKITPSNAVIYKDGVNNNNNYEITYTDGLLKIYYLSTFIDGPHSDPTSPVTKKSYSNSLILNDITPHNGYSAKGWYKAGSKVGDALETITIDGSYTYTSKCIDDIKPTLIDVSVTPEQTDFTISVTAIDFGSGTTKIEWFYKKCGDESYTTLPTTTFTPTNDEVTKTASPNLCLSYGTYYAYVKVTDEAGNVSTSNPIKFNLEKPTTDKVNVNSSTVGTSCKTLECALNQLLEYFK